MTEQSGSCNLATSGRDGRHFRREGGVILIAWLRRGRLQRRQPEGQSRFVAARIEFAVLSAIAVVPAGGRSLWVNAALHTVTYNALQSLAAGLASDSPFHGYMVRGNWSREGCGSLPSQLRIRLAPMKADPVERTAGAALETGRTEDERNPRIAHESCGQANPRSREFLQDEFRRWNSRRSNRDHRGMPSVSSMLRPREPCETLAYG